MKLTNFSFLSILILFSLNAQANFVETISEIQGLKYPNSLEEGSEPVKTFANIKRGDLGGYTELLRYIIPSPNQEGAGSCLYMTMTGVAEWWLSYLNPYESNRFNGPLDLSERYLMNIAGLEEDRNGVKNWKTDSIFLFNNKGYSVLNKNYPFSKGWYKKGKEGYIQAKEEEEGASYGTSYNWVKKLDSITDGQIALPEFDRKILFEDPASDKWNVAVTPEGIIQKVKNALTENRAPVMVMYNHYGYWHVHYIVGFNDDGNKKGCTFTKGAIPFMSKKAKKYTKKAASETDPQKKEKLNKRAKRYTRLSSKLQGAYDEAGGCKGKGVFYVRDSLYGDMQGQMYNFGTTTEEDDAPYTKKVIMLEYEYLRVLSNHLVQIFPKGN